MSLSDIRVDFKEDNEEDTAGRAANTYDGNGLLTKVEITIFKGISGDWFNDAVIERISEHEMGHALGLGHANFDGNLMAELVDEDIEAISECEINAVYEANGWFLKGENYDDTTYMRANPTSPTINSIRCDT